MGNLVVQCIFKGWVSFCWFTQGVLRALIYCVLATYVTCIISMFMFCPASFKDILFSAKFANYCIRGIWSSISAGASGFFLWPFHSGIW